MKVHTFFISWAAFVGGSFITYLLYSLLGVTWKSAPIRVIRQVPNYMSEPRVPDDRSFLKNEIARLSNENRRLQKILNDMNSAIADGRQNATEPDSVLKALKLDIWRYMNESAPEKVKHIHHDDTTVADNLFNKTRVLCWVMTQPSNIQTKAVHIKRTWGTRCNKLLFFSSVGDDKFPVIGLGTGEGREYLTIKTFRAFRYVYEHYFDDFDWFMRTDDDAYVILENLRYFLSGQDTNTPIYFGHKFKVIVQRGYFSGGPGIVLSKEALRRFSTDGLKRCPEVDPGVDDVNIGFCMQKLGVPAGTSLDAEGRTRFHCFEPIYHVMGNYPDWFYKYDANDAKSGISSMSDYAIGFHYVSPTIMYLLEYVVYHLRPYGVKFADLDLNTPVK